MRRLAALAIALVAVALTAAGQSDGPTAFTITTQSLPPAVIGQPYTPVVLQTTGDPIGPMDVLQWSFVPTNSAVPNDFAVGPASFGQQSTTGTFCFGFANPNGPPTCSQNFVTIQATQPGIYSITIQARSLTTGLTASQNYSFVVVNPLQITTTLLPVGTAGQAYSTPIQISGGTTQFTWSIIAGNLPPGIGLDPRTGVLAGTVPGVNGVYTFTVQVLDQLTQFTASQTLSITVVGGLAITVTSTTLPDAILDRPYSFQFQGTGGPPLVWSEQAGWPLPPGFALSPGGLLTSPVGVGNILGKFQLEIQLTNPQLELTTPPNLYPFTLYVTLGPLGINQAALPSTIQNVPYLTQLTAFGGIPPYTWSLGTANTQGLIIGANTGVISGTPANAGNFPIPVVITDSVGRVFSQTFTLTVTPAVSITTASLPNGLTSVFYSNTLTAAGGTPTYHWDLVAGVLPPQLALTTSANSNGLISGTPTTAGTFPFTLRVTDSVGGTATKSFSITISSGPLTITTASLPDGALGGAYSQTLAATGGAIINGAQPYTWSIDSGALPPGIQLNSATGVISGTPTGAGSFTFDVQVADAQQAVAHRTFTINIPQPPAPTTTIGVGATTQPVVTISTSAPYPADITGVLTLTFASSVGGADGGEARFVNGTRTQQFTVPATTQVATFTGTPAIMTGTVAGTITLTASLSAGNQDVTPSPAPTKTIVIAPAVPVITSVTLQQVTGGLNVIVSGYSNTREVSGGSFTFTVSSGNTLSQATIPVSLTSAYTTWFSNSASNATGGQFKLTVPFSVTQGAATAVTKVSVTLTNGQGPSLPVSSQ